jgi:hypothetical protein
MMSILTSFSFWFTVIVCFAVALWSAFSWGWSLGARNKDLQWESKVKALHEKWERDTQKAYCERV